MGWAGGHVEGSGNEDAPGPLQGHDPGQLGEAEVKADAQPHFAEFGVKKGDLISRREGVRLLEILPALHINVEQVDLAVHLGFVLL